MTFRFILIFSLLFQTFGTWAQEHPHTDLLLPDGEFRVANL